MQDPQILGLIFNAGMAGAVLFLFLKGWVYPKPGVDRLEREAERWRKLYEAEHAAHETTRRAHAEETRAALLAGAEAAQITAHLLTEIKSRQSEITK